jgi:uncharacterized iron-regulated membrane protein
MEGAALYRTIWRWHFYAGLLVMPFVLLLSVTGSIYLFKPQIDRWEERAFRGLGTGAEVSPASQVAAALASSPGARFHAYRVPERAGDAAAIHLGWTGTSRMVDVFVSPQGKVLGSLDPDARIAAVVARFHGSMLLGPVGDRLVELAASWAIVLLLTGLYLWWPEGGRLAGVIWPRLSLRGRALWKDIHAVTGFWVAGLALVMLASGLPWAGLWGDAFKAARVELGLLDGPQDWKSGAGGPHAGHDHREMAMAAAPPANLGVLATLVGIAGRERMAFPVSILPPGARQRFGPPTGTVWTIKSEPQNRPLARSITFDLAGHEQARTGFADKASIDRIVETGIAWHEGQLFGWINQVIGLLTALALTTLALSGLVMWRTRKPQAGLGAPPPLPAPAKLRGVAAIILLLAALLPLLAASLIVLWVVERLILARIPAVATWLGMARSGPATARSG